MEQRHAKLDQAEEMLSIFRIYDEGTACRDSERTGLIPTERLKRTLGITLPKETFTKEQDRELKKYAREIDGKADYQQLVACVMEKTAP